MRWLGYAIFYVIAAFYAYGALVHVLNMLSLTGFDWPSAPLKWRVLDVSYLVLDLCVVIGLIKKSPIGIIAFYCAAISQIGLYTVFRPWVLDVPQSFQRSTEDLAYLNALVAFHLVTCAAMAVALYLTRTTTRVAIGASHSGP